jgi:hypothetical protein
MTVYLWLVIVAALGAFEGWLIHDIVINVVAPRIDEWLRRREVVRRSVADQQMQAMRAAQQLSLLAWKARHQMYNLSNHEGDSGPAQRR